jgi:hypothetical protein
MTTRTATPLHERLRRLIPEDVLKKVPEQMKPPAWRDPAPSWAQGGDGIRYVPGARGRIKAKTHALADAKGKPVPSTVWLKPGEEGDIVGLGPDFVVFRRANGDAYQIYRYAVESIGAVKWASRREAMAESLTGRDTQRVERLVRDWQKHHHDLRDTPYWQRRFDAVEDVLAKTRPTRPVQLFRSEPTNEPDQYRTRFTAWSPSYDDVHGFGWGDRRTVSAIFRPEHVVIDIGRFPGLDRRDLGVGEVIVRPGDYKVVPWKPGDKKPARPDAPVQGTESELRERLFTAFQEVFSVRPEKLDHLRSTIDAMSAQELANNLEMVQEKRSKRATLSRSAEDMAPVETFEWRGLPVCIEAAGGDTRHADQRYPQHLPEGWVGMGYIKDVPTFDGDSLDVIIGGAVDESGAIKDDEIYIATQTSPEGDFTQFKVMFGFESEAAAQAGFLLLWPRKMFGDIVTVPRDYFLDTLVERFTVEAQIKFDPQEEKVQDELKQLPESFKQVARDLFAVALQLNAVLGQIYGMLTASGKSPSNGSLTATIARLPDGTTGVHLGVVPVVNRFEQTIRETPVDPGVFDLVEQAKKIERQLFAMSHIQLRRSFLRHVESDDGVYRVSVNLDLDGTMTFALFEGVYSVSTYVGPSLSSDELWNEITSDVSDAYAAVSQRATEFSDEEYKMSNLETIYELEFKWIQLHKVVEKEGLSGLSDAAVRAYYDYTRRLDVAVWNELRLIRDTLQKWVDARRNRDDIERNFWAVFERQLVEFVYGSGRSKLSDERYLQLLKDLASIFNASALQSQLMKDGYPENWLVFVKDFSDAVSKEQLMNYSPEGDSDADAMIFRFKNELNRFSQNERVLTYEGVKGMLATIRGVLFNWNATSLVQKIRALNEALTTAHNNGTMSDWVYGNTRGNEDITRVLTQLSNMGTPPAWGAEVERLLSQPRGAQLEVTQLPRYFTSKPWNLQRNWNAVLSWLIREEPSIFKDVVGRVMGTTSLVDLYEAQYDMDDFFEKLDVVEAELNDRFPELQGRYSNGPDASSSEMLGWAAFDYKKFVLGNTWLVHFTHAGRSIVEEGFTRGVSDPDLLPLTKHLPEDDKDSGGFVFAFEAAGFNAGKATSWYGEDVVMFFAPGVKAYHHYDGDVQVIVWGPSIPTTHMVLIEKTDPGPYGVVARRRDAKRDYVYRGELESCVEWVMNNFTQYRRQITAMPLPAGLPEGWQLQWHEDARRNWLGGKGRLEAKVFDEDGFEVAVARAMQTADKNVWQLVWVKTHQGGWGSYAVSEIMSKLSARGAFLQSDTSVSESHEKFWQKSFDDASLERREVGPRSVYRNWLDKDAPDDAGKQKITNAPWLDYAYRRRGQREQTTPPSVMTIYVGRNEPDLTAKSFGVSSTPFGEMLIGDLFYADAAVKSPFVYELLWTGRLYEGEFTQRGVGEWRFEVDGVVYQTYEGSSSWPAYYERELAAHDFVSQSAPRDATELLVRLTEARESGEVDPLLLDALEERVRSAPVDEVFEVIDLDQIADVLRLAGYDGAVLPRTDTVAVGVWNLGDLDVANVFDTNSRQAALPELALATALLSSPMEDRKVHRPVVVEVAQEVGVDPALLDALVWEESKYDHDATSSVGARGLLQLTPSSWKSLDAAEPQNVREHVSVGARYLKKLIDLFKGDLELALAAYNAGPRKVREAGGVPEYTRAFVDRVLARAQRYRKRGEHHEAGPVDKLKQFLQSDQINFHDNWAAVRQWAYDTDDETWPRILSRVSVAPEDFENFQGDEFAPDFDALCDQIEQRMTAAEKRSFAAWMVQDDPGSAPSWATLKKPEYILGDTWLVHFSPYASSIVEQGFTRGVPKPDNIAFTGYLPEEQLDEGGYTFAFTVADAEKHILSYADRESFVMFFAPGVKAYHTSDRDSQVIVWGPDVPTQNMVLVEYDYAVIDRGGRKGLRGQWEVRSRSGTSNREVLFSSPHIDKIFDWVETNFAQYRRQLTARVAAKIYDSDEAPMYVWRVENEQGIGPYRMYLPDMGIAYDGDESVVSAHPYPHEDFSEKEQKERHGKLYGFATEQDAIRWFSNAGLESMRPFGFQLKRVPARRVWKSQSGRQVFFEPWEERTASLWENVRKKRERGERPAKPGEDDYPDEKTWKKLTAAEWDEDYGQQNAYARDFEVRRVPLSQLASPFMNPVSDARVEELAELTDAGYELPPVVVNGPDEVEETDYPHEKYPFLDGHEPVVGEEVWWLHDGHHRATLALQRGEKFIDAAIIGTTRSS